MEVSKSGEPEVGSASARRLLLSVLLRLYILMVICEPVQSAVTQKGTAAIYAYQFGDSHRMENLRFFL